MQINASFTTPQGVYVGVQADNIREVQAAIDALLGGKSALITPYNGICAGLPPIGKQQQPDETADVKTEVKEPEAKKSASASTKKSSEPSASTATKSSDEPKSDAKPIETPSELDYVRDVQKRVLDFAQKNGRDKTTDMLSRYGVKSAKELKTEQWPDFIAYIDKVAAGGVDPAESDVA